MITLAKPTAQPRSSAPLYHLDIVLRYIQPRIWRRLCLPGSANLGWLHAVIQVAMGWTNSHLHQFQLGPQIYSDPEFDLEGCPGGLPVLDENKAILMSIASRVGDVVGYKYDFGDSWAHQITVKKIVSSDNTAVSTARCLKGARACPPEDCGSVPGYAELLRIITDKRHEEYASTMEWLGGKFDPEALDIERVNVCLGLLKWPRVTEGQLRKVLLACDDYRE